MSERYRPQPENKEKKDPAEAKEKKLFIPASEYTITYVRSRGPGGQKVNKTATKAMLFWNLWQSQVLSEAEKQRVFQKLKNKLDKQGNLIIYAQTERSQKQNKAAVIEKLHQIVEQALKVEKERLPTQPSTQVKERRLQSKKKAGQKKKLRKKIRDWET